MMQMGYGMGAGWLAVTLVVLGALGLIAAVTVAIVRETTGVRRPGGAERVLAERFARGEIDQEEYESRLRILRS